jgi:hypothetical protein
MLDPHTASLEQDRFNKDNDHQDTKAPGEKAKDWRHSVFSLPWCLGVSVVHPFGSRNSNRFGGALNENFIASSTLYHP